LATKLDYAVQTLQLCVCVCVCVCVLSRFVMVTRETCYRCLVKHFYVHILTLLPYIQSCLLLLCDLSVFISSCVTQQCAMLALPFCLVGSPLRYWSGLY